jgi:hypothetical protein
MVSDMSGGELKIDLQPVGAIVKTSEIGQAVSSGGLIARDLDQHVLVAMAHLQKQSAACDTHVSGLGVS